MVSQYKNTPEGSETITPHLVVSDAKAAIEFYKNAFGAKEAFLLPDKASGKVMHASLKFGNSTVMLADEFPHADCGKSPKALGGTPVTIHIYVDSLPEVDSTIDKAALNGARVVMPASDMFWGDRYGQVEDPFGHRWSIGARIPNFVPDFDNIPSCTPA